jgi:hypothetical protein
MEEIEKHQSILNKPISDWSKGIILTLITVLIAYPSSQYAIDILNVNRELYQFLLFYYLFQFFLKVILLIIGLYSIAGLVKEKKLFHLLPAFIFLATTTLWIIVWFKT